MNCREKEANSEKWGKTFHINKLISNKAYLNGKKSYQIIPLGKAHKFFSLPFLGVGNCGPVEEQSRALQNAECLSVKQALQIALLLNS